MRTALHRVSIMDQPRSATAVVLYLATVLAPAMLIGAVVSLMN